MPIITASKTQPTYDVIVVGSGAGGGQTAYTLAMEGVKVLMLEAGRNYDPVKETAMFQTNGQAPLAGTSTVSCAPTDKDCLEPDPLLRGGHGTAWAQVFTGKMPYAQVGLRLELPLSSDVRRKDAARNHP
jgi:choline dehydrogenase-like flavoprotein